MLENVPVPPRAPIEPRAADAAPPRRPQLLFFVSATSGRCRRVEGFLAQVLQGRRNHDTFDVISIDVGQQPALAARFEVDVVPTMIVLDGGEARGRIVSPWGCGPISELLAPWLK